MGAIWSQFFNIPVARLTEKNCPDQSGRVFLVTGGYGGIGLELCQILYTHNAIVWIAGRSHAKAQTAIASIQKASPQSTGQLHFLHVDLSNLSTIKPAVDTFTTKQDRLDVLVNNAAVMYPAQGSKDAQGNDLQMGTNCLAPYLLYQLFFPLLTKTASTAPAGTVRVLWAASVAVHVAAPKPHGMEIAPDGRPHDKGLSPNYGQTKVGNVFFARTFAQSTEDTGVIHAAFNPGNLKTELQRHWKGLSRSITYNYLCHPAIYGAYTELWAALAPELTLDKSGAYIFPWGRMGSLPGGIESAIKGESERETGVAPKFVAWCQEQTKSFA